MPAYIPFRDHFTLRNVGLNESFKYLPSSFFCRVCLVYAATLLGCISKAPEEVVVYTALDREFSEPIFDDFTAATGIRVLPKFDTESTKTVGLYNAIAAEANRPRCDLFWNNEILNTLRLKKGKLLAEYQSPQSANFPAMYHDANGAWHGFAARARVLIVNTDLLQTAEYPTSILDLAESKWQNRIGMAKPLFGTTATHAAVLFEHMSSDPAKKFFESVATNVQVLSGNKQVAVAVARGQLAWGITDTDDAMIEVDKGMPVTIVYPDQLEGQMGTLFIPNSIAMIKGGPNRDSAAKLVDYLLSGEVESELAVGPSAQIPLRKDATIEARVETPRTIRAMEIDFEKAADEWDDAAEFLTELFAR